LYQDGSTLGTLKYLNNNAEVQIGSESNSLGSVIVLHTNISTGTKNNGTLKFLGGEVDVFGSVASDDYKLARIDVGGTGSGVGDDVSSSKPNTHNSVFFNTNVYAHDVSLNGYEAYITLASGYNIKGTSLSSFATFNSGLTLAGGNQTADFANVGGNGSSGASDMLGFIDSGKVSGDISTFTGNVFADNIYTTDGVTNYQKNVTAGDAFIANGTTHFNVAIGTTPSTGVTNIGNRLTFNGTGVANFYQGVTLGSGTVPGAINFNGFGGTVNISAGKNLIGNVINLDSISQAADGTLNFLGGTQLLDGYVGTSTGAYSIGLLHVGSDSQANLTVTGSIYSVETRLSHNSTLNARGNITGNVTNSSTVPAGTLNLTQSYNQSVNGNVGSSSAALALVQAGSSGATTYFNGMVYANTLKFNGNGTVELNGTNGGAAVGGVVGTVDFNNGTGNLNVGDNVNLTFGTSATTFVNANNSSMSFLGSSTVTGTVGGAWTGTTPATSTLRDIFAGANGETVNFLGKVYVSATTFYVSGTGTVNFSDDLVGPLVFEADGTANFNHTKGIVGITAGNGTTRTLNDGQGTLNFLGSTTQDGTIGEYLKRLKQVNFHTDTTRTGVTQILNYDIYAIDTTIGNTGSVSSQPTTSVGIIDANIHLGTNVTMADASTTLYTAGAQTLVGGTSVDFVHTKHADGTLTLPEAAITQSTFDYNLNTNGGKLGFAISSQPYTSSTAPGTYNGVIASDSTLSSQIEGAGYNPLNDYYGSALNMNGSETVQVALLGSLKDNVSYTLVDVTNGEGGMGTSPMPYTLLDNSFTIDTTLSRSNSDADLVITTHRDEFTYLNKSGTKLLGLRSYDLAHRLGQLGAAGTGYSAAVQVVLNKLDLDQWGYGNNEANLARQLYLLTPAGDGAAVKAGTGLTSQAVGVVLDNSDALSTRALPQKNYWVRAFGSHDNQSSKGEYAGYHTNGGGVAVGVDHAVGESILGLAIGYGKATASSSGQREGDKANVDSTIAGVYFRRPVGEYFLNAMIDGAKHRTKTERQTAVGQRANGDYTGTEIGGRIQVGRKFGLSDKKESLTPVVAVNYSRYTQDAYSETGAEGIGLTYTQQKYTQTDASISLRYAVETDLGAGMASSFSASLGYKHLLSNPTYNNTVSFIGDTNTFDAAGIKDSRKGSVIASLAYNYNPRKGVTYTIDYNGEAKSGYNAHSIGFRATWEY
ncbi:MAG: autotransporter domain-containing protein, partial [Opitutae bacterium]